MDFNAKYSRLKHLEEELRKHKSSGVTSKTINFVPSHEQIEKITYLGKKVIVLENDKEYLEHTLSEKDVKLM